jgi:two-component system response regulator FlrC
VPSLGQPEPPQKLHDGKRSAEEQIILETLTKERGRRKATADRLGISARTLRYKIARMREAGIDLPF